MANPKNMVAGHQLRDELGSGPFGRVWEAIDPDGRPVVLKLLLPELAERADAPDVFRRVVDAVEVHRRIDHPYIARAIRVIVQPEAACFGVVSERSPGRPLSMLDVSHAAQDGEERAELSRLLFLFEELGEALHWIHRAGLVHGNVKPTNVIFQRGDFGLVPRVLDLSWSALGVAATPDSVYISPEQFAGRVPVAASDQWSFGTLITRMLTSKRPDRSFGAVPDRLVDVLARCRAREVHERFPSMREAVDELRAARAELERPRGAPRPQRSSGAASRRYEPPVPEARSLATDTGDVDEPKAAASGPASAPADSGRPRPVEARAPRSAAAPEPAPSRPWDVDVDAYDFRPRTARWLILAAAAVLLGVGAALLLTPIPEDDDPPVDPVPLERPAR